MAKTENTVDRKEVVEAIKAIADRNEGRLKPEDIVEAARPVDSPLHRYFEWDAKKAAAAHRLNQARTLIRSVKYAFTVDHRTVKTVAYVRDPEADPNATGYISVDRVRGADDLARDVLLCEFERAAACIRRARKLAKVFALDEDLDAFLADLDLLRTRVSESAGVALNA